MNLFMKLLSGNCFIIDKYVLRVFTGKPTRFLFILVCLLLFFLTWTTHASIGGYITTSDKKKLLQTLAESFKLQGDDISSAYYGAKGYKILGERYDKATITHTCEHIKANFKLSQNLEAVFNAIDTWSLLGCSDKLHTDSTVKV